jgi:Mn-dependent DtxR family transcriptional regulator
MTGAQIKYILTIYRIQKETGARLTDIAEAMQISKPSVYQMIGQLDKMGLVKSNGQGRYGLTQTGQETAAGYARQYLALYQFLIQEICMQQESANTVATSLLALEDHALSELCRCIEQHGHGQEERYFKKAE